MTPTDLPKGATVNVPCLCVFAFERTVRHTNRACYRHGLTDEIAVAATLLRKRGPETALALLRRAA